MEQRSVIRKIADGFVIVGGVGIIFKVLVWVLNFYKLAQPIANVGQRSVMKRVAGFTFDYWPVWVFAFGVFMLACIRYGPPGQWMGKTRTKRIEP